MDEYGKQVLFELRNLREKAQDEHTRALMALNEALAAHGPYCAGEDTHPALRRAYARQEAAELVQTTVEKLVADWLKASRAA